MRLSVSFGLCICFLLVLGGCAEQPPPVEDIQVEEPQIVIEETPEEEVKEPEIEEEIPEENETIPEENESIEPQTEEEKCESSGGNWIAICSSAGCGEWHCDCNNLKPDEQPETGVRSIGYHKPIVNGLCIDCQQDSDCTEVPPVKTGCDNGAKGCYEYTKACEDGFCVSRVIEHLGERCVNEECVYLE